MIVICEKIGGFFGGLGRSAIAWAAGSVDICAAPKLHTNEQQRNVKGRYRMEGYLTMQPNCTPPNCCNQALSAQNPGRRANEWGSN
jgi:hypothetical protein